MHTVNKIILCLFFVQFSAFSYAKDERPVNINDVSEHVERTLGKTSKPFKLSDEMLTGFSHIYEKDIGPTELCSQEQPNRFHFCSSTLRSEGNGPFILTPSSSPSGIVVLFHGLSDSPYFMSSIAEALQKNGYLVIVPLTPGHGKKDADFDMQDDLLLSRWYAHIEDVMKFAHAFNLPITVGGFSTGGAFATHYTINNPEKVNALLLFSGALQLSRSAEAMSNIWGIKTLARYLDGEYKTDGAHPFKYPSVASYAGLVLMDMIKEIRSTLENIESINVPIFAAHSMADKVTLFSGIENLTNTINGNHTIFKIDESYDLCHADLPMSNVQLVTLDFDKSKLENESEECAIPKANPLHSQMILMLTAFLKEHA